LDSQQSVLIVDPLEATREVLQTALERRGLRTFSASRVKQGIELARAHHPDLIVLDLELENSGQEDLSVSFAEQLPSGHSPMVLLGNVRRRSRPEGEFIAKPYQYGPLIRRIEELLEAGPRPHVSPA